MSRFDSALLARARAAIGLQQGPQQPLQAQQPADRHADALALAAGLCRRFEGFLAEPYLCPAGVPTIGYGATHYLDGRPVRMTDAPISRADADALLLAMLRTTYLPAVLTLCPVVTEPGRLAALVDFTYNLGAGNLRASTLRRRVNAGDWDAVPGELRKWVRGGGRVLRGLVARREAEVALL